jgi:hypothetical protein
VPKLWVKGDEKPEGKFLVVRRDGTVPEWPHFVVGAKDPAAYGTLRAYAQAAEILGWDPDYVQSVRELADDFFHYLREHGAGDPTAGPHRQDDPWVVEAMRQPGCRVFIGAVAAFKPKE